MIYELSRWLHIISMISLLGGLLVYQLGLSTPTRIDAADIRGVTRLWNILITIGLIAGAIMYYRSSGWRMGAHFNGVIGLKFAILITVGGLLAVARRRTFADGIRWLAIVLLLIASAAAFTL